MTNDSSLSRRRMLELTGSAALIGLAGCTSTQNNAGQASPEVTQTEQQTATAGASGQEETEGSHSEGESGHSGEESGHSDGEGGHSEEESGHGGSGHGHDEAIGAPSDSAEVRMITQDGGYHFDPHVVRVNVGGTVTWHNESGSHSTTAYHPDNDQPQLVPDGAAAWDSGLLSEEGATFEHTFETEGVYHYYCTPHESLGMIGSIIVGEPDAHGQPALEDPPEDKPESVRNKIAELNQMVNEALGHTH